MKDWIGLVVRLVTGGIWLLAGLLKLPDPSESVRAVRAYEILPESVVPAVGVCRSPLGALSGRARRLTHPPLRCRMCSTNTAMGSYGPYPPPK